MYHCSGMLRKNFSILCQFKSKVQSTFELIEFYRATRLNRLFRLQYLKIFFDLQINTQNFFALKHRGTANRSASTVWINFQKLSFMGRCHWNQPWKLRNYNWFSNLTFEFLLGFNQSVYCNAGSRLNSF